MAFRIGQKVVCVDASGMFGAEPPALFLKRGDVYTIRGAAKECPYWKSGVPVVWLEEVVRSGAVFRGEPAPDMPFAARRFRPVVERKTETGMAILREILERESHQDRVPVKTL